MYGLLTFFKHPKTSKTAELTLWRFKNSPNSVSLLPMPFTLNCMMVNEFPSTACVGIDVGSGCGFGRVGEELQEMHTPVRCYPSSQANLGIF